MKVLRVCIDNEWPTPHISSLLTDNPSILAKVDNNTLVLCGDDESEKSAWRNLIAIICYIDEQGRNFSMVRETYGFLILLPFIERQFGARHDKIFSSSKH